MVANARARLNFALGSALPLIRRIFASRLVRAINLESTDWVFWLLRELARQLQFSTCSLQAAIVAKIAARSTNARVDSASCVLLPLAPSRATGWRRTRLKSALRPQTSALGHQQRQRRLHYCMLRADMGCSKVGGFDSKPFALPREQLDNDGQSVHDRRTNGAFALFTSLLITWWPIAAGIVIVHNTRTRSSYVLI